MYSEAKTQTQFIEEIRQKDSAFIKKFGSYDSFKKVKLKDLFEPLGLTISNYNWYYYSHSYFYSFRNIVEKSGFMIEPAYPPEIYPFSNNQYYLMKSPYGNGQTRNTLQLHLLVKAFINYFLKKNRDINKMNKFINELQVHSKISDIDVHRLKSYMDIFIKQKEIRLGTYYSIVGEKLKSKKVRNKVALSIINTLKGKNNCLDKKLFKTILIFFQKINLSEAPKQLGLIDFQVIEKDKKFSFTGNTLDIKSIIPYNPYLNKGGNLKIDKKLAKSLQKNTNEVQRILKRHIKIDDSIEQNIKKNNFQEQRDVHVNISLHIKYLIKKTLWSIKEIEDYAKKIGSMKMKLILEINEYCDQNYGDFLLIEEDEQSFKINEDIVRSFNGNTKNKAS